MLLVKYIREHIFFHIMVTVVYGLYFLAFILSISEVFCNYGYNEFSIEETTYCFQIYDLSINKVRYLSDLKSTIAPEEISICIKNDDFAMVAFVTPLSNRRDANVNQIAFETHGIKSDSSFYTVEYLSENNFIDRMGYSYLGTINIHYWIENTPDRFFYCSIEDVFNFIDDNSEIFISFLFEQPIENETLSRLKDTVFDSMGVFRYIDHFEKPKEVFLFSTEEFRIILIFGVLCCCCFSRLILALIENRNSEYQIMFFCGETRNKIDMRIFNHIFLILNISVVIGIILFWILRLLFPRLVIYHYDSFNFYLYSYLTFMLTGVMTAWGLLILRRRKHGYFC